MSKIIFTVSELNLASQKLLEECFPSIWVEGEISNLIKATSGHFYFSLKDHKAQIRCALFKSRSQTHQVELRNGLLVQVQGRVSLYPDRGDYQLIVDRIELGGEGLLRQAYEALVKKLTLEGLFADYLKKPLPRFPKCIGVITSPTGAAIRDILSVLKRRFPGIPVFLYPTRVQGSEAAGEIVQAIALANKHNGAEVLILSRGGGSLEDLWPFNEEAVARAIFASHIPIVSGVGHEIDFTIADFVADKRAPTPSAAAELVVPDSNEIFKAFTLITSRLTNQMTRYLQHQTQRLDWLSKQVRHPGQRISEQLQRLASLENRMILLMQQYLKTKENALKNALRAVQTVSPLATLERGYALVSFFGTKELVTSVSQVKPNDVLEIKLKDGNLKASVSDTR